MTFGERVKQVRLTLNLSQEEMAKELGVSFATINRWENSHNNPTYEALQRFEQFCVEKNLKKYNTGIRMPVLYAKIQKGK